ncbi:histone H3T3 kinase [Malassezia pachydermatis]
MQSTNTRQIHVYGRKNRTRIVEKTPAFDENQPATPPPASRSSTQLPVRRSLFAGVDLTSPWPSWMQSPRDTITKKITAPLRSWTSKYDISPPASPTRRPLADLRGNEADTEPSLSTAMADLSLQTPELTSLLSSVDQQSPLSFDTMVTELARQGPLIKIGEASYSDVYQCTPIDGRPARVMKVIALDSGSLDELPRGLTLSPYSSVEREVRLTKALSQPTRTWSAHTVHLHRACVVRGKYPDELLRAWDAFKTTYPSRSENARPDTLPLQQLYALLMMDDAGQELEHVHFTSWTQRAAVFWQTACALAMAERDLGFEHRDLHLSNILVRLDEPTTPQDMATSSANLVEFMAARHAPACTGVRATMIDYALSRIQQGDEIWAYDFSDESIFTGQGDSQYEVYRTMRRLVANDWRDATPMTNVLVRILHMLTYSGSSFCSNDSS